MADTPAVRAIRARRAECVNGAKMLTDRIKNAEEIVARAQTAKKATLEEIESLDKVIKQLGATP
ncbi:MAG: hypothetical protein M3Q39_02175 [Actinomycetota bacterium]|nr:hypothetical protein [Actinomycetota bacterium]